MREDFKDIPDYEGFYQINSEGTVKSVSRYVKGRNGYPALLKDRLMCPSKNSAGYLQVTLSKFSTLKTFHVHKLVAMCFLGHEPDGYTTIVDHINNIKTDNRVENLQVTNSRVNTYKDHVRKSIGSLIGARWHKGNQTWTSGIYIDGKTYHLGTFPDEKSAASAYEYAKDNTDLVVEEYNIRKNGRKRI